MKTLFELPWPPSGNHYRGVTAVGGKPRWYLRPGAKAYFAAVAAYCAGRAKFGDAPLSVVAELFPPDKRKRDLDNSEKCLFDALQRAGVYDDDSQIVEKVVRRCAPVRGGAVRVEIMESTFEREAER